MPQITLKINKRIFNDVYFPYLLDYSHRYEIYYGGAGSGKSHFVFQKFVIKACQQQRKILVVRKTAKSNENSTFQMTKDTLNSFHLLDKCKINKTTQRIELPNSSIFLFAGLDDVEKLKSIAGITDIIIEEATEITAEDYNQLDLRLRAKTNNLQMVCMFNPVSKSNWCYKQWFAENAKYDKEETFILHTTYKDNRFLPEAYIKSIEDLKTRDYTFYKVYALGEFATLDKLVFTNWEIKQFNHELIQGELLIGLDWGFVNDKTALICSLLVEEERAIYIFDSFGQTGLTNPQISSMIKEKGYSKSLIIADSAEQKSIEELREDGITKIKPAKKGKGSIIAGIQKLQAYRIYILPSLLDVIEEFQNYSWKKNKEGEYINEPIDEFNHYIDALRYSLQCSKKKLRVLDKNAL